MSTVLQRYVAIFVQCHFLVLRKTMQIVHIVSSLISKLHSFPQPGEFCTTPQNLNVWHWLYAQCTFHCLCRTLLA